MIGSVTFPAPESRGLTMNAEKSLSDLKLIARLLRQAKPYWPHLSALFVLNLLATPIGLLQPLPIKIVVDNVLGGHPLPRMLASVLPDSATGSSSRLLALAVGLILAVALLSQLRSLALGSLRNYTGQHLVLGFRAQLFRHVQRLSLAFHDSRGTADSIFRIQTDAPAIQHIALNTVIPLIGAATTLVVMLHVIIQIDAQLALVALAVAPFLAIVAQLRRRWLRPRYREAKALESSAQSVLQEALGAVRVVKAFGQEDREQQRFIERSSRGMRARRTLILAEGGFGLANGLLIALGTAAVLLIGARHVQAGTLTLGELLLVMGYLSQLFGPLNTLSDSGANLQSSLAGAERAFMLLDEAPDVVERPHARHLSRARGGLVFQDVTFGYDGENMVLRNLSFEVEPGMRVGIVGRTGAGKTTLVNLLMRFYDPTAGRILLDGVDLRDYRLADLRDQFAMVLQEPVLFSASIAENIEYARPGATEEDIVTAAKIASAHLFITQLPDGYQTVVGERGQRLSGGERQRVSLARAFLKNAPMVILDEPTSSVDVATESEIIEALERLMHQRTTFMIAHRTSTLQSCDLFLRIEDGQLVPAA
jgi:ATP-binding cassette subfamily B protein